MNDFFRVKIGKQYFSKKMNCTINSEDNSTKYKSIQEVKDTIQYFKLNNMYLDKDIKILQISKTVINLESI